MIEATEIEKKSLEAHVELCAERYNALDNRLQGLDSKITDIALLVQELKDYMHQVTEKNNNRLITWGIAIIGFLVASLGWLIQTYVFQ